MRRQHSRHANDNAKLLIYTVLELLTSIRESQFKTQYLWEA